MNKWGICITEICEYMIDTNNTNIQNSKEYITARYINELLLTMPSEML